MPNWTLEGNIGSLESRPPAPLPHIPDLKPAGPVFDKFGGAGIADRIAEAAKAKRRETPATPTLQVDAIGAPTSLRAADAAQVALGMSDRIDKARQLIREKKFREAMEILGEVLASSPVNPHATYLMGYCQFSLGEPEKALRTIAPLIRKTPPPLESMLRQLRTGIHEKMVPAVIEWIGMKSARGDNAAGIHRIENLLALDPDVGIYHCVRIHLLILENRLDDAQAAAQAARPHCHGGDKELLEAMHAEIVRQQFQTDVEPARQHYRNRQYRKARKALEQIRGRWQTDPLWKAFQGYLEALGGGFLSKGRMPSEVVPKASFPVIDRLHFLLVREEVAVGKAFLMAGDLYNSHLAFDQGLELAPHFPYLNYLQAQTIYATVVVESRGDEPVDIERHQTMIERALEHAKVGVKDDDIDGARDLRDRLADLAAMLARFRADLEKQEREIAANLGSLENELQSILAAAQKGITSVELFRTLQGRLRELRKAIPAARKQLSMEGSRARADFFARIVEKNWEQLSKIEPEVEIAEQITAFRERLDDTMQNAPKGPSGMQSLRRSLQSLQTDVEAFRKQKKLTSDAREAVDGILKNVSGLLHQLDEVKSNIDDAEKINPLMTRFNEATRDLKNIRRWKSYEVDALRAAMASILTEGARIRGQVATPQARKNLDELLAAANQIVTALS